MGKTLKSLKSTMNFMPTLLPPCYTQKNWSSLELCFFQGQFLRNAECRVAQRGGDTEKERRQSRCSNSANVAMVAMVAMVLVNQSTTCCAFFSDDDLTCKNARIKHEKCSHTCGTHIFGYTFELWPTKSKSGYFTFVASFTVSPCFT